ncbi:MAG TPA: hypothetical protein VIP28_05935 [Nocardioides sp.]
MAELTDMVDAFLAKYPDDLPLEWRDKPARRHRLDEWSTDSMVAMTSQLGLNSERWNRATKVRPPTEPWRPSPEEVAAFRALLTERAEAVSHG